MQIGIITLGGRQVGVVSWNEGDDVTDPFVSDIDGYVPEGRASDSTLPAPSGAHVSDRAYHHTHRGGHAPAESSGYTPKGQTYQGGGGQPVRQGSAEVDQAIVDAARAHHFDPNFMRSVASIESDMNPSSNANRPTQYKGLYQIGHDEWRRFGEGNIYGARENAMAAARMFDANRTRFREHYGRDPTETELYLMHQQGLGFYTRGAMTNVGGNPYPGMHGAQNHESFEAGWGREVARRKANFAARYQAQETPPADVTFNPETMAP
jgi:hypothetical protein